jgi:hypothetical protein
MGMMLRRHAEAREAKAAADVESLRAENEAAVVEGQAASVVVADLEPAAEAPKFYDHGKRRR